MIPLVAVAAAVILYRQGWPVPSLHDAYAALVLAVAGLLVLFVRRRRRARDDAAGHQRPR